MAYYTHRHLVRLREDEEHPATPGEATLDLAATEAMRLGDRLRGIWDLRLLGADAGLPGLPLEGLAGARRGAQGLGLIGYLDTPERLRGPQEPRFRLLGDLSVRPRASAGAWWTQHRIDDPELRLLGGLDEVWDNLANAGDGTLSGRIERLERSPLQAQEDFRFVAVKRRFRWLASASASTSACSPG